MVPDKNKSTQYVLVTEEGKQYPPKYVIAVANHLANGVDIITDGYNAVEAKNYFETRGYNIESKQEKFELTISAEKLVSTDTRFGVFTSSEEMHKGSAGNVQMNQSIESILRLALNWEQVNGIVINPFGKYIQMTKKMIELLINGYEYNENERKSKDDENN